MSPKRRKKERMPLVAIFGWPLAAATLVLVLLGTTGDPRIDPILRLGYLIPALAALLWAFSRLYDVRRYKKHVMAVLVVAGAEFLLLFLYIFMVLSESRAPTATKPATSRPPTPATRPAAEDA